MELQYHIGKMTNDMENGLVVHVEWFEKEFHSTEDQYLRGEAERIGHLLEVMKPYTGDSTMYPLLARLLGYYLKDVQDRREEEKERESAR